MKIRIKCYTNHKRMNLAFKKDVELANMTISKIYESSQEIIISDWKTKYLVVDCPSKIRGFVIDQIVIEDYLTKEQLCRLWDFLPNIRRKH